MTPEAKARQHIDRKLEQAGWVIQDMKQLDLSVAVGVAVREYPTDSGPADYVLFVNRHGVGVIEAKEDSAGENLTVTEVQTERYGTAHLKWRTDDTPLRFRFEATGQIIRFTDIADPAPRSREIFHFFRPETLAAWLARPETLRRRLAEQMPVLPPQDLRDCQIGAVTGLEQSLALNKPRALVHMATGAGKTFTAITSVYRLLKFGGAKRILFLVDTRNLGKQAHQELMAYTPPDDPRKFTELYNVQRLASSSIDPHSQVCISTIQRMYSILSGEPMDESAEDVSLNEVQQTAKQEKLVRYNPAVPVETFDFIVIDECHRSIYNLWKQVLDYFDAGLIGLTATPDKRTFGFFNENIVAEYTYEQSVADGVNVGYDVYEIITEITRTGAELKARQWVDHRDRQTRKKRWAETEDDTAYTAKELDRSVVNVSQIRKVIQAMKTAVETQIFPARKETPKTLVFAKTDSHADDIINILREVYGQGNAFCKKVTYRAEEDADSILSSFRNDYNPRIAVTVDMIATGTDVKPLEVLLFMRDVRSRGYYEQMKGRGVRSLDGDSLKRVKQLRRRRQEPLRAHRRRGRREIAQDRKPAAREETRPGVERPAARRRLGAPRRRYPAFACEPTGAIGEATGRQGPGANRKDLRRHRGRRSGQGADRRARSGCRRRRRAGHRPGQRHHPQRRHPVARGDRDRPRRARGRRLRALRQTRSA
ncbi:type I restriction endonuclease subunit R [Thiocapsa roseopersicina]|uniref:Type I restriction enzyme, R subunit n=1 Tax=Thiocapsa roseopersicina TaxID=1058 RepID=A0A1H2Z4P1_THIRO|nr:DEAD/DEAH box helicase family protein [Thiocapsa roseopersicina]SDX12301.1 type I restriction enzyme, R subunit [Thiocapsa roseopersicina]